MEIAAYPVPYIPPAVPYVQDVKPTLGTKSDLPSRHGNSGSPEERILQGEVLANGKRRAKSDAVSDRYTFEQRSQREAPDLSSLDPDARIAIRSYLDNADIGVSSYNTRPLIDIYV